VPHDALIYKQREADTGVGEEELDEMEARLTTLVDKHGFQKIIDATARILQKE
jgi:hypothetical protein